MTKDAVACDYVWVFPPVGGIGCVVAVVLARVVAATVMAFIGGCVIRDGVSITGNCGNFIKVVIDLVVVWMCAVMNDHLML